MRESLYRQALLYGWNFALKNRMLWIFGLFAAILGQMGLLEFFTRIHLIAGRTIENYAWAYNKEFLGAMGGLVGGMRFDGWVWLFWFFIMALGFLLVAIFVAVVSQGTLIHVVAQNEEKKSFHISSAWHSGVSHFWRLLSLNVLRKLFVAALVSAIGLAAYSAVFNNSVQSILMFVFVFIISSLVGVILSFLAVYSAGYVVVENENFIGAVIKSWQLFINHWLVSVEVGLIILVLQLVLIILFGFASLLSIIPLLLFWIIALMSGSSVALFIGIICTSAVFIGLITFFASVFTVFTITVWTHLFMKMHRQGVTSRILLWLA